jgi:hypothetical protein
VKGGRGNDDGGSRPRRRATTAVTEPRLTVVEGAELADPAALDDVLELLVTWAIRAHEACCSATDESVNCDNDRSCGVNN